MAAIKEENKAENNKKAAANDLIKQESSTSYGYLNVEDEERKKRSGSVACVTMNTKEIEELKNLF